MRDVSFFNSVEDNINNCDDSFSNQNNSYLNDSKFFQESKYDNSFDYLDDNDFFKEIFKENIDIDQKNEDNQSIILDDFPMEMEKSNNNITVNVTNNLINNSNCNSRESSDNSEDTISLPLAIMKLMKKKGKPLCTNFIINKLKNKKINYKKLKNGNNYSSNFDKAVKMTLRTSGYFYKIQEDVYFYKELKLKKIEDIEKKSKKKNLNSLSNFPSNINSLENGSITTTSSSFKINNSKNTQNYKNKKNNLLLPMNLQIKLYKVEQAIKKLNIKYQSDNKKYYGIILCINLFKSLINKYLFLIKKNKTNTIKEFNVLNDKILCICDTIEKIEKNEIKIPLAEKNYEKMIKYFSNDNSFKLNALSGNFNEGKCNIDDEVKENGNDENDGFDNIAS